MEQVMLNGIAEKTGVICTSLSVLMFSLYRSVQEFFL